MKRLTLMLDESRLIELKRVAAGCGQTLSELADRFLYEGLSREAAPRKCWTSLPVFNMGEPRVNLADREQLRKGMERE